MKKLYTIEISDDKGMTIWRRQTRHMILAYLTYIWYFEVRDYNVHMEICELWH